MAKVYFVGISGILLWRGWDGAVTRMSLEMPWVRMRGEEGGLRCCNV